MAPQLAPDKKRVLYVEDHEDAREILGFLLTGPSYELTTADSCHSAFTLVRNNRFDLLIIDNTLPDGTGIDLCKELRKFDLNTPIIFCSGYGDEEHRNAALAAGAQHYLVKPFDPERLVKLIGETVPTSNTLT